MKWPQGQVSPVFLCRALMLTPVGEYGKVEMAPVPISWTVRAK
jgi:hypothetical protein